MLYELLNSELPANYKRYCNFQDAKPIIDSLENSWVQGTNSLSIPYYSEQYGSTFLTNLLFALSKAGWVTSTVQNRFGSFSLNQPKLNRYLTPTEQQALRTKLRVARYRLRCVEDEQPSNLVKTPLGIKETGLDRPGFAYAANQKFSFDTQYIVKYYDAIKLNALKSMDKMANKHKSIKEDKANYGIITNELLDYYMCHPDKQYNLEANISDQRGRSIYSGLKRVMNPIASKDARAMIVVDRGIVVSESNQAQLDDIFLFIAELTGSKAPTWEQKKFDGMEAYFARTLHNLDLANEDDRKDLHENIWLERIYSRLTDVFDNGYAYWDIPLEMDQTASIAQYVGLYTNDQRLLNKTNVINPDDLQDFWRIDGVPNRNAIKSIGTPVGYGSGQSFTKLLAAKGETLTKPEMKAVKKEFSAGAFGIIKGLKDYFNKGANVDTPTYKVDMYDESYEVVVTKFKAVGATIQAYSAYDTATDKIKIFMNHKVIRVPDYEAYRTYYATGFVHNRDAKGMDNTFVGLKALGEWAIAIHDAGLVLPGSQFRRLFIAELNRQRAIKNKVLSAYSTSIGATTPKAAILLAKVTAKVEQLPEDATFAESALK